MHQRHREGIQVIDWSGEHGLQIGTSVVRDEHLLKGTWLLILFTGITSMTIHVVSGHSRAIPFFISESDYPGLERLVFTAGFTLGGVLLCVLSLRLAHTFDSIHEQKFSHVTKWLGLISGVSLICMSWFSMHDYIIIHSILAMVVFMSGYAWSYTTHITLSNTLSPGQAHRKFWMVVGAVSFAIMNLSLARSVQTHVIDGGLRDGTEIMNMSQAAINIAAPAEYILFLSLVMMLASFRFDLEVRENVSE